jgi:hypothetical protein
MRDERENPEYVGKLGRPFELGRRRRPFAIVENSRVGVRWDTSLYQQHPTFLAMNILYNDLSTAAKGCHRQSCSIIKYCTVGRILHFLTID